MSIENEARPVDPAYDDEGIVPPERETRRIVGELIEEEIPADEQKTQLTNDERRDFARLLTMGRRVKKVVIMDHPVTVQTLKTSDEMLIGLYTKPYLESQGFSRAYQVGMCAAGVIDIDGVSLYEPISEAEDKSSIFNKRAEKIQEYYPIVVTQVYQAIVDLEREFADLAIKLGKLSG